MEPDRLEVLLLKAVLPVDPRMPGTAERPTVDLLEVTRVISAAPLLPLDPVDQLLRPIGVRQPGHEAGAVQIRIDLQLKVDLRPFRDQAEGIVEPRVVADHRAEDHFVVAALRASHTAGHPGVDEHGDAFVIPARRGDPRRGQVHVENAFGLVGDRVHLSPEQTAEHPVAPCRLVHRRHVHQLVVHDRVHPLVGGDRLEGETEGGHLDHHGAARHHRDTGIPPVLEIGEQDGDVRIGFVAKQLRLERERIEEGAHRVGDQVGFGPFEVDHAKVTPLLRAQLGACR